eukprot:SAG25_NODE_42_length_19413_cov_107.539609_8_plen_66_part_00
MCARREILSGVIMVAWLCWPVCGGVWVDFPSCKSISDDYDVHKSLDQREQEEFDRSSLTLPYNRC